MKNFVKELPGQHFCNFQDFPIKIGNFSKYFPTNFFQDIETGHISVENHVEGLQIIKDLSIEHQSIEGLSAGHKSAEDSLSKNNCHLSSLPKI